MKSADGTSRRLVILVHGTLGSPRSLRLVSDVVASSLPDSDQYIPRLPIGPFSFRDPVALDLHLIRAITSILEAGDYSSVIVVAHSLGAIIARRAYVTACGENPDALSPPGSTKLVQPWAGKVDRLVLLAGINQGWSISPQIAPLTALSWTLGSWAGRLRNDG